MPFFRSPRTPQRVYLLIKHLIRDLELEHYTCGEEKLNKYGEPCDPHFHFNFQAHIERVNPKRCIQMNCRNFMAKLDADMKGNKAWSLQMVEEPADYDRWQRYPLKENPVLVFCSQNQTAEHQSLIDSIHLAKLERSDSIAANVLQREKIRNKNTLKDDMYRYIDGLDPNSLDELVNPINPGHQTIWEAIFDYYKQAERPINFTTISGYTNLWLADHGHLSASSAYKLQNKNIQLN